MLDNELNQKISEIHSLLVRLENYIKVTDYEGYCQINKLIESTNYSSLDYLKKLENLQLKEQLDYDYRMMTRARVKEDFIGFCRFAWLQMELMIEILLKEMIKSEKLKAHYENNSSYITGYTYKNEQQKAYMKNKIDIIVSVIKSGDKNMAEKIKKIYNLRNMASHR